VEKPRPVILIATTNAGKLREVRQVLGDLPVELRSLSDWLPLPEPVEDGETFEANAELKARHYARLTGAWSLADDSGLEVHALGGAPGVHSARYAGLQRDDQANNAKLVRDLKNIPPEQRTARFRCAVVLASATEVVGAVSGAVEGLIIDESRGRNGFGYDPHFLVPEFNITTAEMDPEQKNRISHRGLALRRIRPIIERYVVAS